MLLTLVKTIFKMFTSIFYSLDWFQNQFTCSYDILWIYVYIKKIKNSSMTNLSFHVSKPVNLELVYLKGLLVIPNY